MLFVFLIMCWYCQNMYLAGYRDSRTSWLKFTTLRECKSTPFHVVLAYRAKQSHVERNVFFRSLNKCKDCNFKTHDFSCFLYINLFITYLNRDGAVDTETTLRARGSGVRLRTAERNSPILQNIQTGSGFYPDLYLKGTGVLYQGWSGRCLKLTAPSPSSAEFKN
jgi:hypothetical protein